MNMWVARYGRQQTRGLLAVSITAPLAGSGASTAGVKQGPACTRGARPTECNCIDGASWQQAQKGWADRHAMHPSEHIRLQGSLSCGREASVAALRARGRAACPGHEAIKRSPQLPSLRRPPVLEHRRAQTSCMKPARAAWARSGADERGPLPGSEARWPQVVKSHIMAAPNTVSHLLTAQRLILIDCSLPLARFRSQEQLACTLSRNPPRCVVAPLLGR